EFVDAPLLRRPTDVTRTGLRRRPTRGFLHISCRLLALLLRAFLFLDALFFGSLRLFSPMQNGRGALRILLSNRLLVVQELMSEEELEPRASIADHLSYIFTGTYCPCSDTAQGRVAGKRRQTQRERERDIEKERP
ncbi:hypothetical protein DQ04_08491030, partial [Trypanosoma grayi]|uniref:hypothetical protein n=1 Tax=Trypanosoma grayi TaxID=71804 RepID=UPI0004F3F104